MSRRTRDEKFMESITVQPHETTEMVLVSKQGYLDLLRNLEAMRGWRGRTAFDAISLLMVGQRFTEAEVETLTRELRKRLRVSSGEPAGEGQTK